MRWNRYADVIEGGGSQATVAFQENLGVPGYTGEVKVNFAWSVFWSAEITNLCAIGYAATSGTAVVELEANVWDDTSQSSASNGPVWTTSPIPGATHVLCSLDFGAAALPMSTCPSRSILTRGTPTHF